MNAQIRAAAEELVSKSDLCQCARCEGEGYVWADGQAHYASYSGPKTPCPSCGGAGGRYEVPTEEELEAIITRHLAPWMKVMEEMAEALHLIGYGFYEPCNEHEGRLGYVQMTTTAHEPLAAYNALTQPTLAQLVAQTGYTADEAATTEAEASAELAEDDIEQRRRFA